jgi:hypothetical protein
MTQQVQDKIKFHVSGSTSMADIYIGDQWSIRFDGTISASMPADGASSCTL